MTSQLITYRLIDNHPLNDSIDQLYKLLNGMDIPVINVGSRVGGTGYIDYIEEYELDYPLVRGFDRHSRPFIVAKLVCENKHFIRTYFQRYSDDIYTWHECGHASDYFMDTGGGMSAIQIETLVNIMKMDKVLVDKSMRTWAEYIGKIVQLEKNLSDC